MKVITKDSISENLIFDYDIEEGDTLKNVYREGELTDIKILQIDSILINDQYHKVWREACG